MHRIVEWIQSAFGRAELGAHLPSKEGATMDERWRVLVVDDDQDVLDLIRLKLADTYDILCIAKATEVSQAVDVFEPDLIILDIMLPRISGYQIIEYLKRNPRTAKTPVCFLSAKASARDLKHGYSLGAALYLTKPFQPERLVKNVKLFFERTPPPRRQRRFTAGEINERLQVSGSGPQVATLAEETVPERPAPGKAATPPPEEEKDDLTRRRRWVE